MELRNPPEQVAYSVINCRATPNLHRDDHSWNCHRCFGRSDLLVVWIVLFEVLKSFLKHTSRPSTQNDARFVRIYFDLLNPSRCELRLARIDFHEQPWHRFIDRHVHRRLPSPSERRRCY